MMSKKVKIALLLILIILSGFGRDYIMVNINWIIKHLTLGAPNYAQSFFNPLLHWSHSKLILLKWGLTFVFTTYFFVLTYYTIQLIFNNDKVFLNYVKGFYMILIIIAAIIYGLGYIFNSVDLVYTSTRTIMGVLQSFVPLMMLYLIFKFGNIKK